jgi:hypothetical protein
MAELGETCVICFDDPEIGSLMTLKCCGKPICPPCKGKYEMSDTYGVGCPCCRSTLGVVYVNIDMSDLGNVVLRLNGNEVAVACSRRTKRRFMAHSHAPWRTFASQARSVFSENAFHIMLGAESVAAVSAFLQHEVMSNARLKQFVGDRCQAPFDADDVLRWRYRAFWSSYPVHPDEAGDEYDDDIDPLFDPAEFAADYAMEAAAAARELASH